MRNSTLTAVVSACLLLATGCPDDEPLTPASDAALADAVQSGDGTPNGDAETGDGSTPKGDAKTGDAKAGDSSTPKGDAKAGDGSTPTGDGSAPQNLPACNGNVYACADGKDNDGDGLIDARDPECTGPCDNDEGSFGIAIPGANQAACQQDCYWDDDSGRGNDDCIWNLKCDPRSPGSSLSPKCPHDPKYTKCTKTQSAKCLGFCKPLAPNGCDCFGCCEIYVGGSKYKTPIFLGSGTTCSVKTPQNCAPCTQVKECLNGCGECELCLGKTIKDLPPKCFKLPPDGGVSLFDGSVKPPADAGTTPGDAGQPGFDFGSGVPLPTCPPNSSPCISNSHCPTGQYCVTGCCIKPPS